MSAKLEAGLASLFDEFWPSKAIAVPVNSKRDVRVYLADHHGAPAVHVREFRHDWRTGAMAPSHSGAAVPVGRLGGFSPSSQRAQRMPRLA